MCNSSSNMTAKKQAHKRSNKAAASCAELEPQRWRRGHQWQRRRPTGHDQDHSQSPQPNYVFLEPKRERSCRRMVFHHRRKTKSKKTPTRKSSMYQRGFERYCLRIIGETMRCRQLTLKLYRGYSAAIYGLYSSVCYWSTRTTFQCDWWKNEAFVGHCWFRGHRWGRHSRCRWF